MHHSETKGMLELASGYLPSLQSSLDKHIEIESEINCLKIQRDIIFRDFKDELYPDISELFIKTIKENIY